MGRKLKSIVAVVLSVFMVMACIPTTYIHAEGQDEISQIIDNMTLRQKITQCMMIDFRKWSDGDMTVLNDEVAGLLADYQFGAVILFAENIKETNETVALTRDMQTAATSKGGVPLMIATDQEGGIVYRLGSGTALPGNMALAATGDSENAKLAGQIIGRELDSVGINTTLSPVIDVNNNANNPVIGLRSFSDDPDIVGEYGSKYISGLDDYNIIGCAKHFPGHGDVATDSHTGLPKVDKSKDELLNNELKPYKIAISQGIDMIMTAHILYPQLDDTTLRSDKPDGNGNLNDETRPATLSYKILTELLRGELGFDGVVITDAINMAGVNDFFSEELTTLEALKAGADIICMPVTGVTNKTAWTEKMESIISYVENAVYNNDITEERIDQSVRRILTLKKNKGILAYDASKYTDEKALTTVGSSDNRSLEREISAKAVTVIRNDDNTLPLKTKKDSKILMLAAWDDEDALMAMGLNRAKAAKVVPEGVEVKTYCYTKTDAVEGDLKDNIDWADTVIVESEVGNAGAMGYKQWASSAPKNITAYCKEQGKKSVVMSVSKPYDVQMYPEADAIVATYGCKGSKLVASDVIKNAVTDSEKAFGPNIVAGVEVILGVFGASGKLPVNIPVFDAETGRYTNQVAFARGFGLTYDKLGEWKEDTSENKENDNKDSGKDKNSQKEPDTTKKTEQPTTGKLSVTTEKPGKTAASTKAGTVHALRYGTYKVIKDASGKKNGTVAFVKAANKKTFTVPATIRLNNKTFEVVQINANAFKGKNITNVIIEKNIKTISANTFKGSKVKTVTVKTKKLTKKSVKGALKGSSVKTVNVKLGDKALNKKYIKKYSSIFTKDIVGATVSVR